MKAVQKLLLIMAVAGLTIGIPVTVSRARLDAALTIPLPVGVVCLGLFLISLPLREEVERFDEEQHSKITSAKRNPDDAFASREQAWRGEHPRQAGATFKYWNKHNPSAP